MLFLFHCLAVRHIFSIGSLHSWLAACFAWMWPRRTVKPTSRWSCGTATRSWHNVSGSAWKRVGLAGILLDVWAELVVTTPGGTESNLFKHMNLCLHLSNSAEWSECCYNQLCVFNKLLKFKTSCKIRVLFMTGRKRSQSMSLHDPSGWESQLQ